MRPAQSALQRVATCMYAMHENMAVHTRIAHATPKGNIPANTAMLLRMRTYVIPVHMQAHACKDHAPREVDAICLEAAREQL